MEQEKIAFNADLDLKFREGLAHQGDFWYELCFVWALQVYPVLVPIQLFSVTMGDGSQVLPIFTTQADWEGFMSRLPASETIRQWVLMPLFELIGTIDSNKLQIDMLGFNVKDASTPSTGNTAYFSKDELSTKINQYIRVLTLVENEENQKAEPFACYYYVPFFQGQDNRGKVKRVFTTMRSTSGENFIPIYSNLSELAVFFQTPEFVEPFRKNQGQIQAWKYSDFESPSEGINVLRDIDGVSINAMNFENSLRRFEKRPKTLDEYRNW